MSNTTKTVNYNLISKDRDTNEMTVIKKTVLIPDTIGDYVLDAEAIKNACNYLILSDLETKVSNLQASVLNEKNKSTFDRKKLDDKIAKLEHAEHLRDLYLQEIPFPEEPANIIDILFAFLITKKSVNFEGGYKMTKDILHYYNYFLDSDKAHIQEKSDLKKGIIDFVNSRLQGTSFKIDKINDENFKHIVTSCRKNSTMTDKGVKSIVIPETAQNIEKLEIQVLHQLFMSTIGIKTGYVEKKKAVATKYGLTI